MDAMTRGNSLPRSIDQFFWRALGRPQVAIEGGIASRCDNRIQSSPIPTLNPSYVAAGVLINVDFHGSGEERAAGLQVSLYHRIARPFLAVELEGLVRLILDQLQKLS